MNKVFVYISTLVVIFLLEQNVEVTALRQHRRRMKLCRRLGLCYTTPSPLDGTGRRGNRGRHRGSRPTISRFTLPELNDKTTQHPESKTMTPTSTARPGHVGERYLGLESRVRYRARGRKRTKSITHTEPYGGQTIRIRGNSTYYNAGVLEVYRRGSWGLVCDDSWDLIDASVACRQLGFRFGSKQAVGESAYGTNGQTDILMDDVACQGGEQLLQDCSYSTTHDCLLDEAASVVCRPNDGCPDGWISGYGSCYQLYGGARNIMDAFSKCAEINSSLLTVDSQAENDFLSNVLATSRKVDHVWYTAGRRFGKTWSWHPTYKGSQFNESDFNMEKQSTKRPFDFTNWFPGWEPSMFNKQPSTYRRHNCLVLKNIYYHPNRTVVQTDYHFWAAYPCDPKNTRLDFICEKPAEDPVQDCYDGDGSSYRGFVAHTSRGTECVHWSKSPSVNPESHPHKGLGSHNYCRNPDHDTRPWCWVDIREHKFGYCFIDKCSDLNDGGETDTDSNSGDGEHDCPPKDFYCPKEKRCVSGLFKCDGENDCSDGEDEKDCVYTLDSFDKMENMTLSSNATAETHLNIPLEICSQHCSNAKHFICQSFSYKLAGQGCLLHDTSPYFGAALVNSTQYDLYERSAVMFPNCTDKFRCDNGMCVSVDLTCDQHDNCGDNSDEKNCDVGGEIEVRMVNGEEHSGRVEVRYQGEWGIICDDDWDINDSNVVCRMLGYSGAERSSVLSEFGSGNGNILLSNVNCSGTEESLAECGRPPWLEHQCFSFEAAGVVCRVDKVCERSQYTCQDRSCVPLTEVCDGTPDCGDASDEHNCTMQVELLDGSGPHEGRVEVVINGVRGIICDDYWDVDDAIVLCNMLGYRYGGTPYLNAKFGTGGNGTQITMDDVGCDGDETSLQQCQFRGWFTHNCGEEEAAGVSCREAPLLPPTTAAPAKFQVELSGGDQPNEGRVEIIRYGVRGTVCDDSWDDDDATVVCRMLGYSRGTAVSKAHFGAGSGQIWLDDVRCTGLEETLLDCDRKPWLDHDCTHKEDAGVICETDLPDVTVELVGGSAPHEGRVELIIDGERGTICDDLWDNNGANVICRMLGYEYGGIAYKESWFGEASDRVAIFLDDVVCSGSESSILQCENNGLEQHNCAHEEDASVICLTEDATPTPSTRPVQQCGRRPLVHNRNSREARTVNPPRLQKIVGGNIAVHGFYPWQVSVRKVYSVYGNGERLSGHHCGGTVISEYWILSAAHCFRVLPKSRVIVKVGDHNLKRRDDEEQTFEVEELIPHMLYDRTSHDYDIALIKVKPVRGRGIQFSDYVQPACLPDADATYSAGESCLISGWGETGSGYPNILRAATLPIINQRTCNRLYKGALSSRMFCAGYIKGGIDTCQGDSGGPMVCQQNGLYTLYGITSWGNGCAKAYSPGVYARVSSFLAWIRNTVDEDL